MCFMNKINSKFDLNFNCRFSFTIIQISYYSIIIIVNNFFNFIHKYANLNLLILYHYNVIYYHLLIKCIHILVFIYCFIDLYLKCFKVLNSIQQYCFVNRKFIILIYLILLFNFH